MLIRLTTILLLLTFHALACGGRINYSPAEYVSGTLPVLHIDVVDSDYIEVKEPYRQATCWLEDSTGRPLVGSPGNGVALQVKGHGNVTFTELAKKPLTIKFDKKQSLLGLTRSKHFVLMPHADDYRGLVKDELGFELSRQMGMPWTPRQRPVELVLNGDYWGLYFLCEKIRVEQGRVDIEEQDDGETDAELVTGGWLLEIDNYTAEEQVIMTAWNDRMFRVTVHSPDSLSDVQRSYITDLMHRTNEAFYDVDINGGEWEQLVNLDSLALFYLCNEMVDNYEAFSGSCWFYKRRGTDSRLIFGPVWDFGNALERLTTGRPPSFIYDDPRPWWAKKVWIEAVVGSQRFADTVSHYFFDYCQSERLSLTLAHIRDFVSRIVVAGRCDRLRWPDVPSNALQYREGIAEAAFLKKVNWLAQQWGINDIQSHYVISANAGVGGDVDGNGVVDIYDVNLVINLILGKEMTDSLNKDVDINFLNMLINVILGKDNVEPPAPDPDFLSTYSVNGVSFKMVDVKGGTFTMGASEEQTALRPYYDELPTREVTVGDFAIGQTEVTQELWQAVMGDNPSHFTGNLQHPVENVSWNDCQEFIGRLNELTGQQFRLPTETEWEFAARGGGKSLVYAGNNVVGRVAWYDTNACSGVSSANYGTHAVGTKACNELELSDMSGNVWEWCADWYDASRYSDDVTSNPVGPVTGSYRVLRGGSWDSYSWCCRVSARDFCAPWLKFNNIGFRLAL